MYKLYRVENLITNKGLWYNTSDGAATNLIHDLNLTNKDLPMDPDERLSVEKWKSAAESLDQLKFWFTHEDLLKLIPLGFALYEIETDLFKVHSTEFYTHPLFQEKCVKNRNQLDLNLLLN